MHRVDWEQSDHHRRAFGSAKNAASEVNSLCAGKGVTGDMLGVVVCIDVLSCTTGCNDKGWCPRYIGSPLCCASASGGSSSSGDSDCSEDHFFTAVYALCRRAPSSSSSGSSSSGTELLMVY